MAFLADLHIHSHYSIATSKDLVPEYLDYWARIKGIKVVGTGDFTHPGWLAELKEKLEPAETGLFKLKDEYRNKLDLDASFAADQTVRFMLTSEISNIYKKGDRVRKVHNVIFAPDFEIVEKIQQELTRIGNITSDGRPILGLDSRDLLEIALQASEHIFFVPAHIWTPWFSALGSKSGFDSIEEAYGDLAGHISAVETGLSTDAPMNWMCGFLDPYTLLSNSDAHSPEKLGRNANLFDCELSFPAMMEAIKSADGQHFLGTVDLYPQEGKYHYDGHRKCGIRWNPVQTLEHDGICPVCGKKVTVGVMNRIVQLSDREDLSQRPNRLPFHSIIPFKEILSEVLGSGPMSKRITRHYRQLVQKAGSEFNILLHYSLEDLRAIMDEVLVEAIGRMRAGRVIIEEGFDGQYGKIKVFAEEEKKELGLQNSLFFSGVEEKKQIYQSRKLLDFDLHAYRRLRAEKESQDKEAIKPAGLAFKADLNPEQVQAVNHFRGPGLVMAGPGTGKTRVLVSRIIQLIREKHVAPENILAVTFTNQAADEMRRRLAGLCKNRKEAQKITVHTFHGLGYSILQRAGLLTSQTLLFDDADKTKLLKNELGIEAESVKEWSASITAVKQRCLQAAEIEDAQQAVLFEKYQKALRAVSALDLDDLLYQPVLLLRSDSSLVSELHHIYQWILVDEYQDINFVQYRLLRLLSPGDEPNLFVIGDPNQAIYGFRGADVRFIKRFLKDYPLARIYRLKNSYRCSQNILSASGGLVAERDTWLKGLQQGLKVQLAVQPTDKSEAEFVARTVEKMIGGVHFFSMDSGITVGQKEKSIESLSDFAILCRIAKQMPLIEKALNDHRLPYQKIGEQSVFQMRLNRKILHVLRWLGNSKNPFLTEQIRSEGLLQPPDMNWIRERLVKEKTIVNMLSVILNRIPEKERKASDSDLKVLFDVAARFDDDLSAFLKFTTLGSSVDLYDRNVEKVSLMTLHAAKGLEFKCVFIVGCEDGLLPYHLFEQQQTDVEEERRLLYVGMTRASDFLFLSHARQRFLMGRQRSPARSPFLDRIEQDLLQNVRSDHPKKKKPDNQQLSLF